MQWVECIERVGGRLAPIYIDSDGNRTSGSLADIRANMPDRGNRVANSAGTHLQSLQPSDPAEYIRWLGLRDAHAEGQQVYAFELEGKRILVPSSVLLSGLLVRMSLLGDRLLNAGSLDQTAIPFLTADGLDVRLNLAHRNKLTQDTESRFKWLTCYPSARRFWNSVYSHGSMGKLGMDLPEATITASFYGRASRENVFVSRMTVNSIRPLESPMAFADGLVPETFDLRSRFRQSAAESLAAFKATAGPIVKSQTDFPKGPAGWMMTDSEWEIVCGRMRHAGYDCRRHVKPRLDLALEKHAGARTWESMGPSWLSARGAWHRWKMAGMWDALKAILRDIRS